MSVLTTYTACSNALINGFNATASIVVIIPQVEARSTRINSAFHTMRRRSLYGGAESALNVAMTRDAMMVVSHSATRLLPRSRRQLENLSRSNNDEVRAKTLLDPNHAIHRYTDTVAASAVAVARYASRVIE